MRNLMALAILLLIQGKGSAGDPRYPVSAIPDELKANVNAVIREDRNVFTIFSKSRATYYVHQVITIFNEKGKHYASEIVPYDKLSRISELNAAVYDAFGSPIKRLKNNEIHDESAYDGYTLYSDTRYKEIDLTQGTYPYTVDIEYEIEYKFLFMIPGFTVLREERVSAQNSTYTLQFASDLTPRYKTFNTEVQATRSKTKEGLESLTWAFTNIKPLKFEPHGPLRDDLIISIMAAPSRFEYDTYEGTMNTWDLFGQWILSLNKGRNILPEATKQKLRTLTEKLPSREEKVKTVYEYLQNKTRYVSIQLGIGGFQPFEASVVDQTGYGDCKALSNYMVAMLETIGIKSHYALIRAGENARGLQADFPSSQFNHAIVAVPNGADTLWLECTSQTNPFGYQGSFTGGRKALLITDRGAVVVSTIHYTAEQNTQSRVADVYLDVSGNAKASVKTTYSGLQYENGNLAHRLDNTYDDQKKWVLENTNIPSFDVNSFTISNHKNKLPSAVVSLELTLNRYATVSGKRIFLTPNLMNRSTYIPEKLENRRTSVIRRLAYVDMDTIRYHLPEGIYPEFMPDPVKLFSKFGEYEAYYKIDQGSLLYIRRLKMNKGVFAPGTYQELIDFYRGISKADQSKLVFMSKT